MPSRDLLNYVNPKVAIVPQVVADNTVAKSGAIDVSGYESVTFLIETGTLADADATFTVTIKDGADSTQTNHTAVDDAFLLGTEALASFVFSDDSKCFKIGYVGGKKYVSIEIAPANNAGNAPIAAICLLGHPKSMPTANPPN